MTFSHPGYDLIFIQKSACKDESAHLFTYIYKFYSPVTKYWYVLRAEYHESDVIAVKFYCKKDKTSDYKYSRIINRGDVGNILVTCAKVIPVLLQYHPSASFCFCASRTVDEKNKTVEQVRINQRFRTYKYVLERLIGPITFTHFEYEDISSYLMVNNNYRNVNSKERELIKMFAQTYNYLPDL